MKIVSKTNAKRTVAAAAAAMVMGGALVQPAEAGGRDGWRGHRVAPVHVHRHRGPDAGAALAVGIIGGLALGALAAGAQPSYAQPVYPYGPVYGGYRPVGGYYAAPVYAPTCRIVTERYIDAWGDRITRRREICR